jgi:hypothetical protein
MNDMMPNPDGEGWIAPVIEDPPQIPKVGPKGGDKGKGKGKGNGKKEKLVKTGNHQPRENSRGDTVTPWFHTGWCPKGKTCTEVARKGYCKYQHIDTENSWMQKERQLVIRFPPVLQIITSKDKHVMFTFVNTWGQITNLAEFNIDNGTKITEAERALGNDLYITQEMLNPKTKRPERPAKQAPSKDPPVRKRDE